jgi:hypothetical protein
LVLGISVALLAPSAPALAQVATPEELCRPWLVQYEDNNLNIDKHNNTSHVFPPSEAARAREYNEEAFRLNERRAEVLN